MIKTRNYYYEFKIIILILLFFSLLFFMRFSWVNFLSFSNEVEIQRGVMDFGQIENSKSFKTFLDGEWEFFPNTILTTRENKNSTSLIYSNLPESWDTYIKRKPGTTAHGSYYLKIINAPDSERLYGLTIPASLSPYTLSVNDKRIGKYGSEPLNLRTPVLDPRPVTYYFPLQPGDNEIIISGFHRNEHTPGGLTKSLIFGDLQSIENLKWFSAITQIIVCAVFLFYLLYTILLFIVGIRGNSLLYFALLVFSTFITIMVSSNKLLLWYVQLDWIVSTKLFFFSFIMTMLWFILFLNELIKNYVNTKLLNILATFCFVYLLFITAAPIRYIFSTQIIFYALFTISPIILAITTYKVAVRRQKGAIMLLLTATAMINNSVFIIANRFLSTPYSHYPFDLLIAITALSAFWFMRYFHVSVQSKQLFAKLQQEMYRKDDFLANTSHELHTPLQHMLSIAQSLLAKKEQPDLRLLVTIGHHMSFMLDGLLDLIHLKERTIELQIKPINVQHIAASVSDMFQLTIKGKPIELIVDLAPDLPPVLADENRLIQVFINLIHNAIKFTDKGSITIHAKVIGNQLYISIKDTGIGIEKSKQAVIFEPYEQADDTIKSSRHIGLGLGLSICKEIIELHDGSISVASAIGEGSTFTFLLPIANGLTVGHSEDTTESSSILSKYIFLQNDLSNMEQELAVTINKNTASTSLAHILIVDADTLSLQVLLKVLSSESYKIDTALNGAEALEKIRENNFDLIISDIMLPHMSGYDLAKQIREQYSISELPILFLTARQQSEDIRLAFLNGANDYVKKPIEYVELKSRVDALIQVKQSSEERLRFEAAWLQAQIQPHFLFNTLNAIISLHGIDDEKMKELLLAFTNYLQMSFDFQNVDVVVPIDYELKLVQSYLDIEKIRFGDRIQVIWDIPENLMLNVPPLSIQTLVENAIRHGILPQRKGGTITIRIAESKETYMVLIIDNGVGFDMTRPRKQASVGLVNTEQRLKQIFGAELLVESAIGHGTTVAFTVPKSYSQKRI
ncbi:hybrid sensor histidine kinase/response regulator [Bacillus ndiopicus]|uniref:hybrid sensor histidine kinase/response regulator n=1 Tax=Bacillus ndiopicus TaxID=1347368 RepID=UPI0005A83AEF|nr:ATP-binding protein [Bacillus ndiopicus]